MSVLSVATARNEHGAERSVVTLVCSAGPITGCTNTCNTDDVESMIPWAILTGFGDEGNDHFCSKPCLKAWTEKL